jgi:hypothetical protein
MATMNLTTEQTHFRRVVLLGVVAVVVGVLAFVWYKTGLETRAPSFANAPRLIEALQAFSKNRMANKLPLPESIALKDLVAAGYLSNEDARPFDGVEVTFFTRARADNPQSILIRARLQDGTVFGVLGDGSIQQLPKTP